MSRPHVTLLALGGTIASRRTDTGAVPQLTADELVTAVPGLESIAQLEARTFRSVASVALTLPDVVALAAEIRQCAAAGVDGVVVTHGTDTMEETAFALDLLLPPTI